MRLSTQQSSFIFSLPLTFLKPDVINRYNKVIEKNHIQYDNVLDYINSTIISINTPGLSIEQPEQSFKYGKKRLYKPATNIQDIVSTREVSITFRSVDSDLNYMLLFDMFGKHYVDVPNMYIDPFVLTTVDIHRDAMFKYTFYEIILKTFGDNLYDYSKQKVEPKQFTLTFTFNYWDIDFMIDENTILDLSDTPIIIDKYNSKRKD